MGEKDDSFSLSVRFTRTLSRKARKEAHHGA